MSTKLLPNRNNRNWRNPRRNTNLGSRGNPRRQNINFNNNQKCGDDRNINKNKNIPYFHFTRMNQLNLMSNEDIMGILSQRETDFRDFLSTEMRPDVVVLTVRVLLKVCKANFTELVTRILSKACSTNFLKILEHFLMKLTLESDRDMIDNQFYHQNENGFWSELLEFFKKVNEFIPRTACDKLVPLLQKIEKIIPMIELNQNYKISDDIKTKFSRILKDMEENIETMRQKDVANKLGVTDVDVGEPPDDFRNLSVIPTMEDLFDDKPFLRKCIVGKAYDSVEHYLDVQFRLLREDFVSPLRSGIQEFLVGDKKYKNSDFRIYKNVKLIAFENKENDVGVQLFFGNIKNVDWRRSKRLMFGSLLLLSRNNFESVLFATVLNRENKDLERGYVTIMPCAESIITPDMYNSEFVLLESKIYFEPYLEVLTAMKNINSDNFPMEPYFVKAQIDTQLPRYLRGVSMQTFKNSILLPVDRQNVEWPSASALGMNESQHRAFRSALTEEFAIIQGPPGTGKTFLALEIVRTLLENKDYWKKYGPIVVVCLTNHALDQFLEGILHQRCTQSILRVGSRSKSEVLKPYTLMERRRTVAKKSVSNVLLYKTKGELRDILQKIQNLRLHIKYLKTPNVLVPIECLSSCGDEALLNKFKTSTHFHSWLMEIDVSQFLPKSANKQSDKDFEYAFDIKDEEDEEVDENKYTDADLLHDFSNLNVDSYKTVSPLDILDEQLQGINKCLQKVRRDKNVTIARDVLQKLEDDRFTIMERRASICQELKRHPITNQLASRSPNPRWDQYWRCVNASYEKTSEKLFQLEEDHRKKDAELQEIKQLLDTEVMKEHEIVGLTTTLAARLQSSLRTLRAPIVLVEEAAEILEAHVVCSITNECQHVILIGDHKQLRPKASVYELGIKYNLNVSLFERMVNIRGECLQLAYQHRMRPEISKLITPSIYTTLYNHEVVRDFPSVKGVEKNVFFLNHSWPEESHNNEESWKNEHEVKFFLAFAKHLLFQGYQPSEITILCTYTGQLFTFMREVKNHALAKQIRITTVDNYQGEENKIILLSLVRNNGAGNVGFLKEENRVCVALSRAKYGLYVMGNMRDLVVKNNIWPKIKKVLEEDDAIGDSFKLRCQLHTGERVEVW
ncbi:NFX1-type zinc finger-containing protein 1-like [Copidosoma floridanum]|uniref:NFX1-type zinc finger-containing protein 1-like n=1 Tax=Copidosoma floridanum TaxID=29053 RepID=UPI0006C99338|nr:NFX1-type zinc finger-containing protein 1-like [Copidosoma floridanum]